MSAISNTQSPSSPRWKSAQEYEKSFWKRQSEGSTGIDKTAYEFRAERLTGWLTSLEVGSSVDLHESFVVEIGSGPLGLATYLPHGRRMLVDPLNDYYLTRPTLVEHRDPTAEYLTAAGESLPLDNASADLIVSENCIDHVADADAVLDELRRVGKPGALLYLSVNCRSAPGYYAHRVLSRLKIDKGHPHTFTPRRLTRYLERHGFSILDLRCDSYSRAFKTDLTQEGLKGKLKALMGVSEYRCYIIAQAP